MKIWMRRIRPSGSRSNTSASGVRRGAPSTTTVSDSSTVTDPPVGGRRHPVDPHLVARQRGHELRDERDVLVLRRVRVAVGPGAGEPVVGQRRREPLPVVRLDRVEVALDGVPRGSPLRALLGDGLGQEVEVLGPRARRPPRAWPGARWSTARRAGARHRPGAARPGRRARPSPRRSHGGTSTPPRTGRRWRCRTRRRPGSRTRRTPRRCAPTRAGAARSTRPRTPRRSSRAGGGGRHRRASPSRTRCRRRRGSAGASVAANGSRGSGRAGRSRGDRATTTRWGRPAPPASGRGRCGTPRAACRARGRHRRRRSRSRRPRPATAGASASAAARPASRYDSRLRAIWLTWISSVPGVDLEHLGVARQLLDLVLGHVAVAAEELHGLECDLGGRLRRVELPRRRLGQGQLLARALHLDLAEHEVLQVEPGDLHLRASFSWMSWYSPMGLPNCTRSFA